jgi:transcriptional regulator with XRE-family HTH domain
MENFGERLKEERKRLGLNQGQLADRAGTTNVAQSRYESGDRSPDWGYLSAVAQVGVDVLYVLTGQRSSALLSPDEDLLLSGYRSLDAKGRAGVLGLIGGMTQSDRATTTMSFKGPVGQQVHGDVTYTGSVELNVGEERKKK